MLPRWLLPALLAVLWTTGSLAAPITVSFPGVFTYVDGFVLDPAIEAGTSFTISYTVGSNPRSIFCHPKSSGFSCTYLPSVSARLSVSGTTFQADIVPSVKISDDLPGDAWELLVSLTGARFWIDFRDPTGRQVTYPIEYFVNDTLDGWETARLTISSNDARAVGTIIPEPTSAALLLPALLALLAWRIARRRRSLAALALLAGVSTSSPASAAPIVFDFEDGLQGWELSGSAQRVQTQVLGEEWAIFGDGLLDGTSAVTLEIDLSQIRAISVEMFLIEHDLEGISAGVWLGILDVIFIGEFVPFPVPDPVVNPTVRTVEIPFETVSPVSILWARGECLAGEPPCLIFTFDRHSVAFIDNITFYPVPEPGYLGVLGLVGVWVVRRVTRART